MRIYRFRMIKGEEKSSSSTTPSGEYPDLLTLYGYAPPTPTPPTPLTATAITTTTTATTTTSTTISLLPLLPTIPLIPLIPPLPTIPLIPLIPIILLPLLPLIRPLPPLPLRPLLQFPLIILSYTLWPSVQQHKIKEHQPSLARPPLLSQFPPLSLSPNVSPANVANVLSPTFASSKLHQTLFEIKR